MTKQKTPFGCFSKCRERPICPLINAARETRTLMTLRSQRPACPVVSFALLLGNAVRPLTNAARETRTLMTLRSQRPERCASTNSAIAALVRG